MPSKRKTNSRNILRLLSGPSRWEELPKYISQSSNQLLLIIVDGPQPVGLICTADGLSLAKPGSQIRLSKRLIWSRPSLLPIPHPIRCVSLCLKAMHRATLPHPIFFPLSTFIIFRYAIQHLISIHLKIKPRTKPRERSPKSTSSNRILVTASWLQPAIWLIFAGTYIRHVYSRQPTANSQAPNPTKALPRLAPP